MSCGEIKFLDGGIIKNAQILDSNLLSCLLSNCTFDSGKISNLLEIDAASAGRIFDAFQNIDPDKLKNLAKLLLSLLTPKELLEYLSTADAEDLKKFIKLLLDSLTPEELLEYLLNAFEQLESSTETPDSTRTSTLPTTMYGDHRKGLMGGPDKWIKLGSYLIPAYTVSDGQTEVSNFLSGLGG